MNRSGIALIVLLLIAGAMGAFIVWPKYQDWQLAETNLRVVQSDLNKLKEVQSLVKSLEAAEPTLSDKATAAKQLVPDQEERETFVSEIDALARANGMSLATFSFAATQKKAASDEADAGGDKTAAAPAASKKAAKAAATPLGYNASLTGSFASLEQFLAQIKQTKRYTDIASFILSAPDTTDANGAVTFQMIGTIYSQPLPKTPSVLKFSTSAWDYLTPSPAPAITSTVGRPDPFAKF